MHISLLHVKLIIRFLLLTCFPICVTQGFFNDLILNLVNYRLEDHSVYYALTEDGLIQCLWGFFSPLLWSLFASATTSLIIPRIYLSINTWKGLVIILFYVIERKITAKSCSALFVPTEWNVGSKIILRFGVVPLCSEVHPQILHMLTFLGLLKGKHLLNSLVQQKCA